MSNDIKGLWVAPFVIDGEMEGMVFCRRDSLSSKWLRICSEHLDHYGPVFDAPWASSLSHIRTKFTSESGIATATFFVGDRVAASSLLLSGMSPAAEADVIAMFTESMRRVCSVRGTAMSRSPFSSLPGLRERPLLATVPWPDNTVSEADHELVRELELHLACAYLCSSSSSDPIAESRN